MQDHSAQPQDFTFFKGHHNTVSVETYYCLGRAVGNNLMFEVEVIDPKDDQRDMAKED